MSRCLSPPPAQPWGCCCCGLDTCLQLFPAPTFAKLQELQHARCQPQAWHGGQRVQIPPFTRARRRDPRTQDGAHVCRTPGSMRGNLHADGPAVVGGGWEITCVCARRCLGLHARACA